MSHLSETYVIRLRNFSCGSMHFRQHQPDEWGQAQLPGFIEAGPDFSPRRLWPLR